MFLKDHERWVTHNLALDGQADGRPEAHTLMTARPCGHGVAGTSLLTRPC